MRKTLLFATAVLLVFCGSCQKGTDPDAEKVEITAHDADAPNRTVLSSDKITILWNAGEEIDLLTQSTSFLFHSTNTAPQATATFEGSGSIAFGDGYVYGVYPHSADNARNGDVLTLMVPSEQIAVEGSFGQGAFPSVGRSKSKDFAFYNVCGGVCFTLSQSGIYKILISGNNNEDIAGKVNLSFDASGIPAVSSVVEASKCVSLSAPQGFATGKVYYVSLLPANFSKGLTFEFFKNSDGSEHGTKSISESREVKRAKFGSIENVDSGVSFSASVQSLAFANPNNAAFLNIPSQLVFYTTPSDATYSSIKWTSSDETIATVDQTGKVTGKKTGKCEITALTNNGKKATCKVIVCQKIMIHLAGDSTCAEKTASVRPNTGWGEKFSICLNSDRLYKVNNKAVGGKSTKTFISGGYWTKLLNDFINANNVNGDYVFIQFGHNDESTSSSDDRGTKAFGDFTTNLTKMVGDVREKGGVPVLLTPIVRRQFNNDGTVKDTHGDYLVAIKNVARDTHTLLLDMEQSTRLWLANLGVEGSLSRYMYGSDGKDNTHLQTLGAEEVAALVAKAMKNSSDATLAAMSK